MKVCVISILVGEVFRVTPCMHFNNVPHFIIHYFAVKCVNSQRKGKDALQHFNRKTSSLILNSVLNKGYGLV